MGSQTVKTCMGNKCIDMYNRASISMEGIKEMGLERVLQDHY